MSRLWLEWLVLFFSFSYVFCFFDHYNMWPIWLIIHVCIPNCNQDQPTLNLFVHSIPMIFQKEKEKLQNNEEKKEEQVYAVFLNVGLKCVVSSERERNLFVAHWIREIRFWCYLFCLLLKFKKFTPKLKVACKH